MQTHRIVKAFEVLENGRPSLSPRAKLRAIHTLTFEFVEKRFHRSVIVTISGAAHTDFNAQCSEERLIAPTG